jgi:hypothetical protein
MQKLLSKKESLNAARKVGFGFAMIMLLRAWMKYTDLLHGVEPAVQSVSGLQRWAYGFLWPYFGKFAPVVWELVSVSILLCFAMVAHLNFQKLKACK